MARPSVYNRILHKAAEIVGGERALARYLKIPQAEVYAWMRPGASPPPIAVFLKATDLVLNDLDTPDEQRAQSVRVAVIHEDRRRAAVMQQLDELLPDEAPSRHDDSVRAKVK
ncbi:MAG TPA: hypothetical protein VGF58_11830 [Burkholderiales bacterium]|jgi:hypothetical protein